MKFARLFSKKKKTKKQYLHSKFQYGDEVALGKEKEGEKN